MAYFEIYFALLMAGDGRGCLSLIVDNGRGSRGLTNGRGKHNLIMQNQGRLWLRVHDLFCPVVSDFLIHHCHLARSLIKFLFIPQGDDPSLHLTNPIHVIWRLWSLSRLGCRSSRIYVTPRKAGSSQTRSFLAIIENSHSLINQCNCCWIEYVIKYRK